MSKRLLTLLVMIIPAMALWAQPPNDNCADAVTIALDEVVSFSTEGASTDGPRHPTAACFGTAGNDSIPLDIWYVYMATTDGPLKWSNCGTGNFDSRMAVYLGTPCPPTDADLLACNDDGPASCSASFFTSEVVFSAVAGQTYTLRLGGYSDGDLVGEGTGTVVLSGVNGPANDFCATATPITIGNEQPFSTFDATTDGPDHPGSPCFGFGSTTAGSDVWYTFTPDYTGFAEWSTCGTATFDTRLAVYPPGTACPPADGDLMSCNDDGAGCASFSSLVVFPVEAGLTYLLRLGGYNNDNGSGTFNLVAVTPPAPPANDDCTSPATTPIIAREEADGFDVYTEGVTVSGTFVPEDYQYPPCLSNQNGGEFADVWYTVNTLGNESLELRLFAIGDGVNDATTFYMDVFTACDVQLDTLLGNTCLSTSADNTLGVGTISGLPTTPTVLLIRVSTRLTSDVPGTFGLQVVGEIITDTDEPTFADALDVFPNPASTYVDVRYTLRAATPVQAVLYDLLGRPIGRYNWGLQAAGAQRQRLDIGHLPTGFYTLQLDNGLARQTVKFMRQ